jgi:uncharacterized HAD superfamily protein
MKISEKDRLQQQLEMLQSDMTRLKNLTYKSEYEQFNNAQKYLIAEQYKLEMKLIDIIQARLSLT